MFEHAAQDKRLSREVFDATVPGLRVDLLNAQFDLREAPFSVLIVIAGDDLWGCSEVVDLLHEWLDARYLKTRVFVPPHEKKRPRFWPYWNELPAAGRIGVYDGAWPIRLLSERLSGRMGKKEFKRLIARAGRFERTLAAGGTLVLKFWFHRPKSKLAALIKRSMKRSRAQWQITPFDRKLYKAYDEAMDAAKQLLEATHSEQCPWHVVASSDRRFRDVTVGQVIRDALRARLDRTAAPAPAPAAAQEPVADVLASVDLGRHLEEEAYKAKLSREQARLNALTYEARERGQASVLVFEGWDAAGKGGVIRRITRAMAARDFRIVPIAAPTADEKARHYLWRFWKEVPPPGRMVIFDRSWYGRVLVERVEGFAREDEWRRSYDEINDFESQLADHGIMVAKFWLHIDPDEQLRRFEARKDTPYKKHKITEEDYRNRSRWDAYAAAVQEMVARTDTRDAPWKIIAANDKRFARIEVLRTVRRALERALRGK